MRRAAVLGLLVAALAAPGAQAASWTALAPSASSADALVTPIDLGTNTPGPGIGTSSKLAHLGVAITPDARTAYVVSALSHALIGIDLTTSPPTAGAPVDLPAGVRYIAIAPDGRKAYVPAGNVVVPIDLTTSPVGVGTPIAVGAGTGGIAFTPDGAKAYVTSATNGSVTPITVATDTAGPAITGVGTAPDQIAVTPDGSRAYVTDNGSSNVYPITLASGTVGLPISVGSGLQPAGIAVTPDGMTAYTANFGPEGTGTGTGNTVTPIALATGTAGTPITVGNGPWSVAVAPDGKTVYTGNSNDSTVTPIDVATGVASAAITGVHAPRSLAITPDQAPVASFNVTSAPPGAATTFDASPSTVRYGTIASYAWEFGDGATGTTPGPTTSHVYATAGTYTATVTETDSAGTSTDTVYTGQTVSRAGGAGARASRSVVVTSGPAAAVSLSTGALDFGSVGVGAHSDTKTVTVSNPGSAPLSISDITVTGADFAADGCAERSVAAGASCVLSITFTPAAAGVRNGSLAITDNASGSPHTVTLTGTGDTSGTVTGTVRDSAGPLRGSYVTFCTITFSDCRGAITDADGHYRFASVKAGSYIATIYPPSGSSLAEGTRLADVAAGQTVDATTVLRKPTSLPDSISITSPTGTSSGGQPTIYWDSPFQISLPPLKPLPAHAAPHTTVATTVFVALKTAGTDQTVLGSALTTYVKYDGSGDPATASIVANPLPGTIDAGFDFVVGGVAAPAGKVVLTDAAGLAANTRIVAQAPSLQRRAHGTLSLSILAGRSQAVDSSRRAATAHTADVCDDAEQDVKNREDQLRVLMPKLVDAEIDLAREENSSDPDGDTLDELEATVRDLQSEARRTQFEIDALTEAAVDLCGQVPPPAPPPCDPDNIFSLELPCPQAGPVQVDPSGFVRTMRGVPLEKAKVVLQRSDVAKGPFAALPDGDAQMAPNNRRNPDRTDIDGHFGWDVSPGYYRVRATRTGCKGSALTKGLPVPPPVTNLKLKLSCPGLHRAKSHTRVLRLRRRGPDTLVTVRVRSRKLPIGLVTVARVHGFLKHGRATIVLPARHKHVVARYAGNARWAPSRGRR